MTIGASGSKIHQVLTQRNSKGSSRRRWERLRKRRIIKRVLRIKYRLSSRSTLIHMDPASPFSIPGWKQQSQEALTSIQNLQNLNKSWKCSQDRLQSSIRNWKAKHQVWRIWSSLFLRAEVTVSLMKIFIKWSVPISLRDRRAKRLRSLKNNC